MRETISVATANTHNGRMLQSPDGLTPFRGAGVDNGPVDVLLMQEVFGEGMDEEGLGKRLERDGYQLAHLFGAAGLAIAYSAESGIKLEPGTGKDVVLQPRGRFARTMEKVGIDMQERLRVRGMATIPLITPGGNKFIAASAHPIIFIKPRARARQVRRIGKTLQHEEYRDIPVVVGADMNHYPGPRRVDEEMVAEAGLIRALFTEPTWLIQGSKHEWAARYLGAPNGNLDVLLSRGTEAPRTRVIDVESDHKAGIGEYVLSYIRK